MYFYIIYIKKNLYSYMMWKLTNIKPIIKLMWIHMGWVVSKECTNFIISSMLHIRYICIYICKSMTYVHFNNLVYVKFVILSYRYTFDRVKFFMIAKAQSWKLWRLAPDALFLPLKKSWGRTTLELKQT